MPPEVLIDDTHVLMTPQVFQALPEYSLSVPTGVEFGKAWRRREPDGTWLVAPRATRTASTDGGDEFDLDAVKSWLKEHGPAKAGAIAKEFGVHSTKAAKLMLKADGFRRLGDGRFSAT